MKYLKAALLINLLALNVMAKEIKTELVIKASPEKVWQVLTDFNKYPEWNPFIKSLHGEMVLGSKFRVKIQPPNGKEMEFKPTLLVYSKNQEFKWLGHFGIKGIFDGEHRFQLIDNVDGTTTFIQSERFSGILVPFLKKMLEIDTKNGFELMNEQLRKRVEYSSL